MRSLDTLSYDLFENFCKTYLVIPVHRIVEKTVKVVTHRRCRTYNIPTITAQHKHLRMLAQVNHRLRDMVRRFRKSVYDSEIRQTLIDLDGFGYHQKAKDHYMANYMKRIFLNVEKNMTKQNSRHNFLVKRKKTSKRKKDPEKRREKRDVQIQQCLVTNPRRAHELKMKQYQHIWIAYSCGSYGAFPRTLENMYAKAERMRKSIQKKIDTTTTY